MCVPDCYATIKSAMQMNRIRLLLLCAELRVEERISIILVGDRVGLELPYFSPPHTYIQCCLPLSIILQGLFYLLYPFIPNKLPELYLPAYNQTRNQACARRKRFDEVSLYVFKFVHFTFYDYIQAKTRTRSIPRLHLAQATA